MCTATHCPLKSYTTPTNKRMPQYIFYMHECQCNYSKLISNRFSLKMTIIVTAEQDSVAGTDLADFLSPH